VLGLSLDGRVHSVGQSTEPHHLGFRLGFLDWLTSRRHRPDNDNTKPLCLHPFEQSTNFSSIAHQDGGVCPFDEEIVALLCRVARVFDVVDGEHEHRKPTRAGITRRECWHTLPTCGKDLNIRQTVYEKGIQGVTKPSVLEPLTATDDENAESHASECEHGVRAWRCRLWFPHALAHRRTFAGGEP